MGDPGMATATSEPEIDRDHDMGQALPVGLAYGIPLAVRLGIEYLRFKRKAKRASRLFRKEMLDKGIDREVADVLTDEYLRTSRLLRELGIFEMMRQGQRH